MTKRQNNETKASEKSYRFKINLTHLFSDILTHLSEIGQKENDIIF